MVIHKTKLRVRYADTDQMQFAYNGKYFEYFEVGRTEMLRDNGLTYKGVEERGYQLPVHSVGIEYKSPAFYDDLLTIETIVPEKPTAKIRIEHRIFVEERNVLICTGFVQLVFREKATGKVCRPPAFFLEALAKYYE